MQKDLQAASEQVTDFTAKLEAAEKQLKEAESKLASAEKDTAETRSSLDSVIPRSIELLCLMPSALKMNVLRAQPVALAVERPTVLLAMLCWSSA